MNRGAERLGKEFEAYGEKTLFARRIGVADYQLSHWLAGRRKPNNAQRRWLEDHLGIDWRLWDVEIIPVANRRSKFRLKPVDKVRKATPTPTPRASKRGAA